MVAARPSIAHLPPIFTTLPLPQFYHPQHSVIFRSIFPPPFLAQLVYAIVC